MGRLGDNRLGFFHCLSVLYSALVNTRSAFISKQCQNEKLKKKDGQEFEAENFYVITSCREIGCGYKSLEHFTQEYV